MSEYWKSQPRKFCDFCKCWIADNKPSKDFHEKGKKHQENVKKKLDELRKKGVKDAQKKEEMNDAFREMEEAALKAFKKDLMNNPSLAAQYGVRQKSEVSSAKPEKPGVGDCVPSTAKSEEDDVNAPANWSEAQTPEGYTYYWNTVTAESRWEKPEGYVSPAEWLQPEPTEGTIELEVAEAPVKPAEEDTKDGEENKAESEDGDSSADEDSSEDEKEDKKEHSAYGRWETVRVQQEPEIDLQLPVSTTKQDVEEKVIAISEPKIKFKEKKVTSLGSSSLFNSGPTAFKKRKINSGAARNIRKRDDDS